MKLKLIKYYKGVPEGSVFTEFKDLGKGWYEVLFCSALGSYHIALPSKYLEIIDEEPK